MDKLGLEPSNLHGDYNFPTQFKHNPAVYWVYKKGSESFRSPEAGKINVGECLHISAD